MAFISNFPILTNGKVEKIYQGAHNSTWYSYIATNLQLRNIMKLLTNVYLKGNEIWSAITDFLVKKVLGSWQQIVIATIHGLRF